MLGLTADELQSWGSQPQSFPSFLAGSWAEQGARGTERAARLGPRESLNWLINSCD